MGPSVLGGLAQDRQILHEDTIMPGTVKWVEDYKEGLAQASKESKMVFVDVTADW